MKEALVHIKPHLHEVAVKGAKIIFGSTGMITLIDGFGLIDWLQTIDITIKIIVGCLAIIFGWFSIYEKWFKLLIAQKVWSDVESGEDIVTDYQRLLQEHELHKHGELKTRKDD